MKRLLFSIVILFVFKLNLLSQESIIGLGAGINNYNGYQFDFEMGYNINEYLQPFLSARIQDMEHFGGGYYSDSKTIKSWKVDDKEFFNILFIPSLNFSIPFIRKKDGLWSFNIQPGIMIQPFSQDYLDVKYETLNNSPSITTFQTKRVTGDFKIARFYWLNKFAIQYRSEDMALFGCFELSNQDVYSKRRSVKIDGVSIESHLPGRKNVCNSIFVGIRFYL
jgi:hypothetical protein